MVSANPEARADVVAVEVQAQADLRDLVRKRVRALHSAPLGADDPFTGMKKFTKVVSLDEVMEAIDCL